MTKKTYKYPIVMHMASIIALMMCFSVTTVSCSDEFDMPKGAGETQLHEKGFITLNIKCGNNISRAEEPGIDDLNENKISSVTLCLSPNAGDRTDSDAPVYFQTFTNLDVDNEAVLRVPLTQELITRLFNENATKTCRAFAAVNISEILEENRIYTVAELRGLTVGSMFALDKKQSEFTMDGDDVVNYDPNDNYATGKVTVKRSAAKVTLALNVDENVTETVDGETLTWMPDLDGMIVRLQQGVRTSQLDPNPKPNMDLDVYFNTPADKHYNFEKVTRAEEDIYKEYDREQDTPFYTYPNKWTGSTNERHGTFMMLSVPWTSDGGTTWRTCYYHVPIIPNNKFELIRNTSYHVMLHVGVLGSFLPEEPLEVEADYYVADWGKEDIDVDIKDYRYLVVDQSDYVVNNEESTSIPFYTSHKTVVTDVKMKFYRYNFSDQGSEFAVEVYPEQNKLSAERSESKTDSVYSCTFDDSNNTLNLSHSLNVWVPYNASNNEVLLTRTLAGTRANLDNKAEIQAVLNTIAYFKEKLNDGEYSRIEYEVTVQHADVADGTSGIDKKLYKETVRITQYPGMYITAVQNYAANLGSSWASGALGNTQISGNYSDVTTYSPTSHYSDFWSFEDYPYGATTNRWNQKGKKEYFYAVNEKNWNYSLGLSSKFGNWNPNMYLVTVTQLEPGTGYKIDDPRSYNINNFLDDNNVNDENLTTWNGDYYYFNKSNGNGPETSTSNIFKGLTNPVNRRITGWSSQYWMEYAVEGFIEALDGEGKKRKLQYYYPTREDEANSNTIAPKFRICSSYGGTSAFLTRSMARRRAAAYQEMGYAAGRWRLPTYSEVRFLIDLAKDQKIPRLFGSSSDLPWYYWCAQGAIYVPGKTASNQDDVHIEPDPKTDNPSETYNGLFTGNNYRDHARFVYDEWYWGEGTLTPSSATPNSTSPTYTFTWGDRIKTNPEN